MRKDSLGLTALAILTDSAVCGIRVCPWQVPPTLEQGFSREIAVFPGYISLSPAQAS